MMLYLFPMMKALLSQPFYLPSLTSPVDLDISVEDFGNTKGSHIISKPNIEKIEHNVAGMGEDGQCFTAVQHM